MLTWYKKRDEQSQQEEEPGEGGRGFVTYGSHPCVTEEGCGRTKGVKSRRRTITKEEGGKSPWNPRDYPCMSSGDCDVTDGRNSYNSKDAKANDIQYFTGKWNMRTLMSRFQ